MVGAQINIKKTILLASLVFAGCSSVQKAPPLSERDLPDAGAVPEDQRPSSEQEVEAPAKAPVLARDVEEKEPELAAVTYLLDQAEEALANNEPDRAGALSDRAIQIDRKSPRAYLIMALSHLAENKLDHAIASARQGLLYTSEKSEVGQKLKALIQR